VKEKGVSSVAAIVIVIVLAAIGGGTVAIYFFKAPIGEVPINVIQTFALLAVVVLSAVTFWYQTLRSPKFKIHPSRIGPIELYWHQDEAVGDLNIIVSNEGAKIGTISEIDVLEGGQVSENIKCYPIQPLDRLPAAIRVGEPISVHLRLKATDMAQRETYRIRIRVKGSDTCETEEFDVKMP